MKTNLFEYIQTLANSTEEQYFIEDEEGNLSEISAGKVGKIVKVTAKNDLYNLIFDKERIGLDEIKSIEAFDFNALKAELISVFYNNLTYKLKKEGQSELKDIIAKYGLKELKERARKQ